MKRGGRRRKVQKRFRARKREIPRTVKQFFALAEHEQDRWTRVTHVVSKMRSDGVSLTKAVQEFALDRETVLRLAKPALRKRSNGRYVAKPHDELLRVLVIPTPQGLSEIAMRDSEEASRLAEYWNAVELYRDEGDESALTEFKGKSIRDISGKRVPLLTSIEELDILGNAGQLSFESLYARAS